MWRRWAPWWSTSLIRSCSPRWWRRSGSWLGGSPRRSIKLLLGDDVLELTGVSSKEQRRLADEWLDRHTAGG
jgi:hypothetical protein